MLTLNHTHTHSQRLVTRLAERRMRLQLEDSALEYLAQIGFDPVFGARPVKRALQRELQTLLAKVCSCVCCFVGV